MKSWLQASPSAPSSSRTVSREPAGPEMPYRGYVLIPMRETIRFGDDAGTRERMRWDVIEHVQVEGQPTLKNRVKTCASQISAEGWVDSFGEPTDAPAAP